MGHFAAGGFNLARQIEAAKAERKSNLFARSSRCPWPRRQDCGKTCLSVCVSKVALEVEGARESVRREGGANEITRMGDQETLSAGGDKERVSTSNLVPAEEGLSGRARRGKCHG